MSDNQEIRLPQSGLANEILDQFVANAQEEVDKKMAVPAAAQEEKIFHIVSFMLGREEYGVEIQNVQEIIRAVDITPVPGSPVHVKGVINLRGKIIPVIDLRKRFSLPDISLTERHRIIITEIGLKRLGVLVDSVSQVLKFSSAVMEDIPEEVTT